MATVSLCRTSTIGSNVSSLMPGTLLSTPSETNGVPRRYSIWRQCIENNEIQDLVLTKTHLTIVRYGNTFKLCTSMKKNKYQDYLQPVPAAQLAEEDPCEKKDPDYFPHKDSDDELD